MHDWKSRILIEGVESLVGESRGQKGQIRLEAAARDQEWTRESLESARQSGQGRVQAAGADG